MLQPTDVGRRGTSQWKIAVCESAAHKDKGIANSSEIKKIASVKGYKNAKKYV